MKHTLLIALLGATISFATPSLSFADSGHKFKHGSEHKHGKSHKHKHKKHHRKHDKKFVVKPPKPHRIVKKIHRDIHKHNRHHNKHQHVKKHYRNKHNYHYNEPSFSISWNVGDSTISYGNNDYYYDNHNYQRQGARKIYKRINKQANRIQRGVESGQLVRREAKKLRREQRHIKSTLSHYKRDGHLNRYERSKMHQLLDVASNNIHRKKHNQLTRHTRHHNYNYGYVQF